MFLKIEFLTGDVQFYYTVKNTCTRIFPIIFVGIFTNFAAVNLHNYIIF